MAATDHAIIIGLQNYPGLDDPGNGQPPLSGAENDARAFYNWVSDVNGGDVPTGNIEMVLSSNHPGPYPNYFDAKPAFNEIARMFYQLYQRWEQNINNGADPKIGRRLYIFMSGHGITPNRFDEDNEKEAALLMSNVYRYNVVSPTFHIPGVYTANWYSKNDCFDEVFLFMDCCRNSKIVPALNIFLPKPGSSTKATRFYAFATKWSLPAREKPIMDKNGNMEVRGIFSKTLLEGLSGAAADPDPANPGQGIITGASLKSFLYQNMKEYIDPQFLNDPELQEPDVDYWPKAKDGHDIIIKTVSQVPLFSVEVAVSAGKTGELTIYTSQFTVAKKINIPNAPQKENFSLPRGKYLAILVSNGITNNQTFDIKGIENVNGSPSIQITF